MNSISLDAVAALTGIGRSTLWRKVADGALAKGEKDARGRATLALADVLGLTIETVSRQFTRLKADGLIDLPSRREVVILDREGLAAEAG